MYVSHISGGAIPNWWYKRALMNFSEIAYIYITYRYLTLYYSIIYLCIIYLFKRTYFAFPRIISWYPYRNYTRQYYTNKPILILYIFVQNKNVDTLTLEINRKWGPFKSILRKISLVFVKRFVLASIVPHNFLSTPYSLFKRVIITFAIGERIQNE